MRKFGVCLLVLIMCVSLLAVGCGKKEDPKPASPEKIVLKFASCTPPGHSLTKNMEQFASIVKEKTNGRITVDLFVNSQLGSNQQQAEALQMGTLDMQLVTASAMAQFSKAFMLLDLPYLFKTDAAAKQVLNGSIGQKMSKDLEKSNIKTLCVITQGWRHITANKPIKKPTDLKGIKIRILSTPVFQDYFVLLGASPTPMAFAEVFSGLQQGVINAQENPFEQIELMGFHEVQKYVMMDGHCFDGVLINISMKTWNKLSAQDKAILESASQQLVDDNFRITAETNKAIKEKYIARNKPQVIQFTNEELEEFRKTVQPVYDKYAPQIGQDLLNEVINFQKDMKYERNY